MAQFPCDDVNFLITSLRRCSATQRLVHRSGFVATSIVPNNLKLPYCSRLFWLNKKENIGYTIASKQNKGKPGVEPHLHCIHCSNDTPEDLSNSLSFFQHITGKNSQMSLLFAEGNLINRNTNLHYSTVALGEFTHTPPKCEAH